MDDDTVGMGLIIVGAIGYGTLAIIGKFIYATPLSIASALTFRFFISTVALWAIIFILSQTEYTSLIGTDEIRLGGRDLLTAFALGSIGYSGMTTLYFWGLELMQAGMVAIILYTYPIFVLVFSSYALDESISHRVVIALPFALVGVTLIARGNPGGATLTGVIVVFLAGILYAFYLTGSRLVLTGVNSIVLTAYVMPAAGVYFLLYSSVFRGLQLPTTTYQWYLVVLLALVGTVIPSISLFAGLSRVQVNRAALLNTFEPVATIFLGMAFLNETPTLLSGLGGGLILTSVYLVVSE